MAFEAYNIVDNTTGAIVQQIGADVTIDPNAVNHNTPPGTTAYTGDPNDKPDDWYYVSGTKTARPTFSGSWNTTSIAANGTSTATFGTGLPNPTTIIVYVPDRVGLNQPGPITETSGSFSLNTTVAGTYRVLFDAFPYKQMITEIVAT